MTMPIPLHELGELQLTVLNALWTLKNATVHDVLGFLPEEERKPAYTTVLTVLRKLERYELITHEAVEGSRMHRYRPIISPQDVREDILKDVLTRLFAGSPALLIKYILQTEGFSIAELRDIKGMIETQEKQIVLRGGQVSFSSNLRD